MAKKKEALNLSFLLEHEREMILSVLQKDEKLRKREEKRIRKLKNELLELKRGSRRSNSEQRECGVCLRALGLILQRGSVCDDCKRRVCSFCVAVSPNSSHSKCTVCAKTAELKVVTGEWFLEERAKRFDRVTLPSSDVIKQSILNSPPESAQRKVYQSRTNRTGTPQPERSPTPQSEKSVGGRSLGKKKIIKSLAVESSGRPTTPNNMRPQPDRLSAQAEGRKRPDGAESVYSFHSSDSIADKVCGGQNRKDSATPSIAVSRASLSSDRSRSELDLSNPGEGFANDSLPSRCHSVPGLNDAESDEDIDALLSAHYKTSRSVGSAQSVSSTPRSERKWSFLNVPDSDAETSSLNSMMSVYSETGDYGNARVSGEILLNISYSYKTGALNVLVRECRCLATGDERKQRTDPYVKTYLLPDKSRQSKRKTSIKNNTTNPVFNENLRYVVSHSQLETRTLQVSVWHHDRFGHNSFLGETELTFDSWEFDTQIEEWFALQPRAEGSVDSMIQYKGELTVVLKYIPAERNLSLPLDQIQVKKGFLKGKKSITLPKGGMVELLVKEAKNLTAVKSGSSDPFVKGYLLPDDKKSTKHKTAVVKRSVNPRWNHTFTYCGLQHTDLDSVCLELTVWDKEPLASNVFLGGVRLGAGTGLSYGKEVDWNDSYGEEQRLWQRMIDNPEVPQECTLMLRSSMAKRKA
ncbi:synaptotagmin-like protein 5 isoform X1 [Astyanax mexicanus]|uniref:Synaptotagmin-like protein 5 n=1 Tax=Astyanax mexicanus TaxID=7994 RepID=A0A8T2LMV8_ASTMX|nr:synaptotagmin-like protein 5 isoform X1 [Astyanax mexicanus]